MTRSVWKGPFIDASLIKLRLTAPSSSPFGPFSGDPLAQGAKARAQWVPGKGATALRKVWSRRSCILPQFVGCYTQIYNGRKWIGLKITEEMVGHKFGEFASTRTIGRTHAEKRSTSKTKLKAKAR